jgi:RpiB/LacA/LacB family sugar-phosphate isomerase
MERSAPPESPHVASRQRFGVAVFDFPSGILVALQTATLHWGAIVRIGFGSDRTGFECKERLRARFVAQGHAAEDVSAGDFGQSDCHALADHLASAIYDGRFERGVLICSSAIGASVAANKHLGVRAALCHDVYSARHGVEDDGMNCLVMGACVVTPDSACELADVFLDASYAPREPLSGISPRRLARVVEYVRNNLDKPLAVAALCRMADMSQSHFSKLFKLSTGLAPHQFVLQERINRSKELLRQDHAKIVEVALGVGFENQAHFTTVFGNLVGMTPRQFQRFSSWQSGGMRLPESSAAQCF